jgi:hypothetical protein
MNTSKALAQMYKLIEEKEGPVLARESLSSIIYIILEEIQNEGLEVSDELLEKKIEAEAINISKAAKRDVA